MRIALVTAGGIDPGETDDAHLDAALARRGVQVAWHAWDAADVDWCGYDLVVLRSCWNYHRRADAFAKWLAECNRRGVRLANPHAVVAMNLHKRYLVRLARLGLPVPPLRLLTRGSRIEYGELVATLGPELVLKPAISASAWRTVRTHAVADPQAELDALLADGDVIVQRYVPEIADGEWSLVLFRGEYSHAVMKRPAAGDFRSQYEHGASVTPAEPDAGLVALAAQALACFPPTVYARVDVVAGAGASCLMEVELIEPELYFRFAPGAADRAAEVILAAARGGMPREAPAPSPR